VIGTAPLVLRLVIGVLAAVLGAWFALLGTLAVGGRLRQGGTLGVCTPAAMADAEHFGLANRVAGAPWVAAGAIGLVTGALAFLVPGTSAVLTVGILGLLATVGLAMAGAVLGHRAAAALPASACAGCACLGVCGTERVSSL
jgi:hypothetical protein